MRFPTIGYRVWFLAELVSRAVSHPACDWTTIYSDIPYLPVFSLSRKFQNSERPIESAKGSPQLRECTSLCDLHVVVAVFVRCVGSVGRLGLGSSH